MAQICQKITVTNYGQLSRQFIFNQSRAVIGNSIRLLDHPSARRLLPFRHCTHARTLGVINNKDLIKRSSFYDMIITRHISNVTVTESYLASTAEYDRWLRRADTRSQLQGRSRRQPELTAGHGGTSPSHQRHDAAAAGRCRSRRTSGSGRPRRSSSRSTGHAC